MKVWKLHSHLKSPTYNLINRALDHKKIDSIETGELLNSDEMVSLELTVKGTMKDFPHFSPGVLILSSKALEILKPKIDKNIQIIHTNEKDLFIANIINIIDSKECVDYNRSVSQNNRRGEISNFKIVYFLKERIQDELIFKISIDNHTKLSVYVTDTFREIILNSKLRGFDFEEVWDSELTEEMEKETKQHYEDKIKEIDQYQGQKYKWLDAEKLVQAGKAIVSGKWKLQENKAGVVMLGQLGEDLQYHWINPTFLPPILLDLKWHEDEKSDL